MPAVATSTTIPKYHSVVITTLSNPRRPNVLATKYKLSDGVEHYGI